MKLKYRSLVAPTQVQFEMTGACNRSCLYCANDWRGENIHEPVITSEQITSFVARLKEAKVFECVVTGGEPLMCRDQAIRLAEELRKNAISVSMNTNASMVDEHFVQWVAANRIPVFTSFMSFRRDSFDEISGRTGEFERTIIGLKSLLAAGARVQANMVVSKININDIFETCKFLKNLGVGSFSATRVCPSSIGTWRHELSLDRHDVRSLFSQLQAAALELKVNVISSTSYPLCAFEDSQSTFFVDHRLSCAAGRLMCSVSPTGDVKPCGFVSEQHGNIFDEPLQEIWKRLQSWRDGSLIPSNCHDCSHLFACGGGCRASGLHSGYVDGHDPLADFEYAKSDKFCQMSFKQEIEKDIETSKKFSWTNHFIRSRGEDFGCTLFAPKRFPIFLSNDGLCVISLLRDGPKSIDDISELTTFSKQDIKSLFGILAKAEIIQ